MRKSRIFIVIGHSGSGKSTLAKTLGEYFACDALGFSYAGKVLAKEDADSTRFAEINDYIFQCIRASADKSIITFVDGLASVEIVHRLDTEGYLVSILFLDTPYGKRIQRIMLRENCSIQEARVIEQIKAQGKAKSGLLSVIQEAEYRIDGSNSINKVASSAITYIEEKLKSENCSSIKNK